MLAARLTDSVDEAIAPHFLGCWWGDRPLRTKRHAAADCLLRHYDRCPTCGHLHDRHSAAAAHFLGFGGGGGAIAYRYGSMFNLQV